MNQQTQQQTPPAETTFTHGTRYAFTVKKCKCDACRGWWAANRRDYRARRKAREA